MSWFFVNNENENFESEDDFFDEELWDFDPDEMGDLIDSTTPIVSTTPVEETYRSVYSKDKIFILYPSKGFFVEITKKNAKGIDIPHQEHLFVWKNLKILRKYLVEEGRDAVYHYDFKIDRQTYIDYSPQEIQKKLIQTCFQGMGGEKQLTICLAKFLANEDVPDESDKVRSILGFLEDGWALPDTHIYRARDQIFWSHHKTWKKIFKTEITTDELTETKAQIKRLYDITGVPHKDLLFAWAFVAPFMFVLKRVPKIAYSLILALGGPADTGKSAITKMIIEKFYGMSKCILEGDAVTKEGRVLRNTINSTLPVGFDECENMAEKVVTSFKSQATSQVDFQRAGEGVAGQDFSIDREMAAALLLNFNVEPFFFNDKAFLERLLYICMAEIVQNEEWGEIYEEIPDGAILRYIYTMSKDWNEQKIIQYYNEADSCGFNSGRLRKAAKIMNIGVRLAKEWFDLNLSLSDLPRILNLSRNMGDVNIKEMMLWQYYHAQYSCRTLHANNTDELFYEYKPNGWAKFPVRFGRVSRMIHKEGGAQETIEVEGYGWDLNNVRDLQSSIETKVDRKWNLDQALLRIRSIFPNAEKSQVYLYTLTPKSIMELFKVRAWCIFIPKTDLGPISPYEQRAEEKQLQNEYEQYITQQIDGAEFLPITYESDDE